MSKLFHLGFFLSGSQGYGWGHPWSGDVQAEWMKPDQFVFLARELERACLDYILIEDNVYVPDQSSGNMDIYLKNGLAAPRRDPMILAAYMLQATQHIGIVPTVTTFATHPYLLARQLGSLDQLSGGRTGWNVVTGSSNRGVQNFGMDEQLPHDTRYEQASEFMDVANALWDSWDADAIVADPVSGVLADPGKVRTIDFDGKWYRSRGPLNSGPAPQGRPVVAQAGSSPKGREFAARYAETIVVDGAQPEYAKAYRDQVRAMAQGFGRDPDEIKMMIVFSPIIGESDEDVRMRLQLRRDFNMKTTEQYLAVMAKTVSINFGDLPLDEPLDPTGMATEGTKKTLETFIAANKGKTLRQAVTDMREPDPRWVGTPRQIADNMEALMEAVGGDGFLLGGMITRRYVTELVDGLVPELQRRGLHRTRYSGATLRENLRAF